MDWRQLITVDPAVAHGQACFSGTRIPASVVLDNLAAGVTQGDLLASYQSLTLASIQAAMAYAAELSKERVLSISA